MPLMVYPTVLFHPNFSIKGSHEDDLSFLEAGSRCGSMHTPLWQRIVTNCRFGVFGIHMRSFNSALLYSIPDCA